MTTAPTTDLEAANARAAEAQAAWDRADYAAAARDWTKAAEHLENVWWAMHRTTKSPDAANMRRNARAAIIRRDQISAEQESTAQQDHPRITLTGKIGGWQ
jgi:hypothetical protein